MTVYLDVLLISNLWVDYCLLQAVAKFTHIRLQSRRAWIAAAIGAFSALAIFLPPMPWIVCWSIRFLLSGLLVRIAFGPMHFARLLRQTIWFYVTGLFFCGVIYTLGTQISAIHIVTSNSVLYADLSLLVLLLGAVISVGAVSLTARKKDTPDLSVYRLELQLDDHSISMPAMPDSGNHLKDPFTGRAVILCPLSRVQNWIAAYTTPETAAAAQKGFRMLPVKTVTGQKVLPAFLPKEIVLHRGTERFHPDAMIALTAEETPALFSPNLLL